MCKKNNFQIFLLFAIKMTVLSAFLLKKGLGPLGVKHAQKMNKISNTQL